MPEARIAIAHGQMDEGTLEQVVLDFWEGEYDVLVCTTIIESGIDMPTVNTLVVDRADLLGLGQLHQLRGRVGRAGQRAYAYLFHPPRPGAHRGGLRAAARPSARPPSSGSGFKIAMRDLEIRGAGNLLGTGQSGHIAAVGYDLYCQMVTEAVAELKGEEVREPAEIKLDLPARRQPPDRLRAPRRSCGSRPTGAWPRSPTEAEVDDIRAEWEDRYGPVPAAAAALLDVARLRAECGPARHPRDQRGQGHRHRRRRVDRPHEPGQAQGVRGDPPAAGSCPAACTRPSWASWSVPTTGGRGVATDLVELLATLFPAKAAA